MLTLEKECVTSAKLIALEVEVDLALFDLWLAEQLEDPYFLTSH
jgi:hypothetical protein